MKDPLIKITIIAERIIKEPILELLKEKGATGFTMTFCEGEGARGMHASDLEGQNVQIDSIADAHTADDILREVSEKYLEDYSVIAYLTEVSVLRKSKFSS